MSGARPINAVLLTSALCLISAPQVPPELVTLSDDGGWCWYQDERAIVHAGKLLVGAISMGVEDAARRGDAELIVLDLESRRPQRLTLRDRLGADDHNAPAFEILPDGRVLGVYATHGNVNAFWYRLSEPNDPLRWGPEQTFVPSTQSRITYSNVFCLSGEGNRIYNFYRGYDNSFKPSYAVSDNLASSWYNGGIFINVPTRERHRPYVKYCSDGERTIHMLYTEGHPRDYDNGVYHAFYRDGQLHTSAGQPIAPLNKGLSRPQQGTRLYAGGPTHVAWVQDLHLDEQGHPIAVFSVQHDPPGLPPGHPDSGQDHRYHYARWDGTRWQQTEIAYAGTRLYPQEDDYTGLIAIDPHDVKVVFISTNADPATGEPLISQTDARRHYEIYRGVSLDGGKRFRWTPVTRDSDCDNLRPLVPRTGADPRILLWLRGALRTYTDYDLDVVGWLDVGP